MKTHRFSPVVLACAAAISLLSFQAHAQTTSINLSNNASLAAGMSSAGARSYDTKATTSASGSAGSASNSPNAGNVGTAGAGNTGGTTSVGTAGTNSSTGSSTGGSSGSSTIAGTTEMPNASNGQYTYNSNGQMVSTGGSSGDFMGPPAPIQGTVVGAGGTAAAGGMDWLKMVQIAAPVVAGLSGNAQIGQIAGLAGSGAQIYNAVSTGQDLSMQNYANIANIALQGAALATNNTNIDKAAALGTLGTGAWNAYSALTPGTTNTAATAATGTLAGYSASGQPVYTSNVPTTAGSTAAGSAFNWGAVASIAQSTAPALGNITGNATIGQLGQAVGLTGQVYNQTGGFNNAPNTQQLAGIVSNGASQVGYMTGNTQLQQVSQVANTTGQLAGVYNAQGQQVYAQPQQQVYNAQGQPVYVQTQQSSLPFGQTPPFVAATQPTYSIGVSTSQATVASQPTYSGVYTAADFSTSKATLPASVMSAASNPTVFSASADPRQQALDAANARTTAQITSIGTGVASGAMSAITGWLK